jgi:hypothetical protein
MRFVFSLVGILVAVVIVLLLARNQLAATRGLVDSTRSSVPAPTGGATRVPGAIDASGTAATATIPEVSQQIQRNVAKDVGAALQQGIDRTKAANP